MTLIELLVLAAILGMLVVVGVPMYGTYRDKARNARAAADIVAIQFDLRAYTAVGSGQLPNNLEALGRGTIRDPWGNSYRYLNIAAVPGHREVRKDRFLVPLNSDYDLYSMGKDGVSKAPLTATQSRDDIIRAGNGAFIGLAADF
jgi:general secretion pathway protein G